MMPPLDHPDEIPRSKMLDILLAQTASLSRLEGKVDAVYAEVRDGREARISLTRRVDKLETSVSASRAKIATYAALGAGAITIFVNFLLRYLR